MTLDVLYPVELRGAYADRLEGLGVEVRVGDHGRCYVPRWAAVLIVNLDVPRAYDERLPTAGARHADLYARFARVVRAHSVAALEGAYALGGEGALTALARGDT